MIVYGHRTFALDVPAFIGRFTSRVARLPVLAGHDDVVELIVEMAEAESAIADHFLSDADDEDAALGPWREAAGLTAQALCHSCRGRSEQAGDALRVAAAILTPLRGAEVPASVRARHLEGFSCYALYPEQYILAARQLFEALRPRRVLCLGLRSIGAMLAHVVAAALDEQGCRAQVRSIRPRGHPFDRQAILKPRLRQFIRSGFSHVAIVDEGPGISGSSFAAGVEAASAAGVDAARIVIIAAWQPPAGALRSPRARDVWARQQIFTAPFESLQLHPWSEFLPNPRTLDISAGRWRELPDSPGWPAVHPQHERRKVLAEDGEDRQVWRFAGLGAYGRHKLERATALFEAGFGARPVALRRGFLGLDWKAGHSAQPSAADGPASAHWIGNYIGWLRRERSTGETADVSDVANMIRTNVSDAFGAPALPAVDRLTGTARFDEPAIAIDARVLPHEFIISHGSSGRSMMKADALDHHDDDFFPGCRDAAWDVAGALEEWPLDADGTAALVTQYRDVSGDRSIDARLPFYRVAYLSYRLAYTALAADTLGTTEDAVRFRREAERYRRSLGARLAATPSGQPH